MVGGPFRSALAEARYCRLNGSRSGVLAVVVVCTYNEDGVWKSKVEGNSSAAHAGETKAEQQAVGR